MSNIQWYNCFSGLRFGADSLAEPERTEYERDYDRIIYSSPFRRLQNKTQVFPLPDSVFVHNRLTHSLEVASVGRSLAKKCGRALIEMHSENWNDSVTQFYRYDFPFVISAACLAHDIGNPPFGHSGESAISQYFQVNSNQTIGGKILREWFTNAQWQDFLRFEGNANGFRLLTHHFPTRLSGGFRLTYSTMAAMAKYPCSAEASDKTKGIHRKKFGFFQTDMQRFVEMAERLNMIMENETPRSYLRHPFVYLVEAADDMCYLIMDWEDAHRLGILSFETASKALLELLENAEADMSRVAENLQGLANDPNESIAYLRAKAIGALVEACTSVFAKNNHAILRGEFMQPLIDGVPKKLVQTLEEMRSTSVSHIYRHPSVARIELSGYQVINGLMEAYIPAVLSENPTGSERSIRELMPGQYHLPKNASPYEKVLGVLDFISGMTDIYALRLYQEIKGIRISLYS